MTSKRTNPHFRQSNTEEKHEPETVMVIQSSVEDPLLNSPPKKEEKPKHTGPIPRPDDPAIMQDIPEWMAAAIHSTDELQVIEDHSKGLGPTYRVEDKPNAPAPIQSEFDDLDNTRLEKKELLARAKFMQDSIKKEREFYSQQRARRAVLIPEVPSDKLMYSEDTTISYMPYTVQDLEDINNEDVPLYNKYLIMLEGIYTTGMTPLELTFSDFTFIGDTRHLQAMGDAYFKYPYVCSSCRREGLYQFTLGEVGFQTLKGPLPLKVRFHTFPDEIFMFVPHTIGDILHLMKADKYWRKMGEDYIISESGKKILDRIAINACRCISHPWAESYFRLLEASENPLDRAIISDIGRLLYHGSEPIKFRCEIPLDKSAQARMAEITTGVVNDVVAGNLSVVTPNEEQNKEDIPPWLLAHMDDGEKPKARPGGLKKCGAVNEIDVVAGDIIIPFRRRPINLEYGILSA